MQVFLFCSTAAYPFDQLRASPSINSGQALRQAQDIALRQAHDTAQAQIIEKLL
jgi:hypothetical protein